MAVKLGAYSGYIDQLEAWACGHDELDHARIAAHLDGEASRRLRQAVPLEQLRTLGAFFTSSQLARCLLALVPRDRERFVDPACGSGDLLLAASALLPVLPSLEDTLRYWNERLVGRDKVPTFVRATRARLALSAIARGAERTGQPSRVTDLLTNVRAGDGSRTRVGSGWTLLLNPPFGQVKAPAGCTWTSGRTTQAALLSSDLLQSCADGAYVAAILPEVLRAGSRYERYRKAVHRRLRVHSVQSAGLFDQLTDIDVFLLAGEVTSSGSQPRPWTPIGPVDGLERLCDVRVGPVVDYRDPHEGPARLFLDARGRGRDPQVWPSIRRRFAGTVFEPPFVVIPRTNRPAVGNSPRLRATIVRADEPVAVENHLLALLPHRRTVAECRGLVRIMQSEATTAFLDERLRCRHLTVKAVREVPL